MSARVDLFSEWLSEHPCATWPPRFYDLTDTDELEAAAVWVDRLISGFTGWVCDDEVTSVTPEQSPWPAPTP